MTDPIKRTGPAPVDPGASGAGGVGGAGAPRSDAFREVLEAERTGATSAPTVSADLQRLAEEIRAGRATPEAVLDALVARQLASGAAALLGPAQRAQLESLLRSRLAEDPALVSLGLGLARAGTPEAR